MKNFLLATTILVASAGFAVAEITLSGDARMGIVDNGGVDGAVFSSRARVSFNMAGETDGGLAFGASFRADNAAAECSSAAYTQVIPAITVGDLDAAFAQAGLVGDEDYDGTVVAVPARTVSVPASVCGGGAVNGMAGTVFISGAFGKLSMGDNDGAAQATVGQVDGVGYTGNGDLNEIAYITGGADPSVLYTYSTGAVTVNASLGQTTSDERAVGVAYAGEGFGLNLGIEDNGTASHVVVGASASMANVSVKAVYGELNPDVGANQSQYALSATYSADALSVTLFHSSSLAEVQSNGIGLSYALGGGATVAAGYSKAETADGRFDAGVSFAF